MVHARTEADLFWAMEEALKSRGLGAVLGETASAPPVNVRRLQLATEEGGVPLVLLRPFAMRGPAASAVTRWRIAAAPSRDRPAKGGAEPLTRWRVELVRCRGGVSGAWMLDWCDETARLGVVADLRDRPVAAIEPRPPLSAAG
jgi:protein ImuA